MASESTYQHQSSDKENIPFNDKDLAGISSENMKENDEMALTESDVDARVTHDAEEYRTESPRRVRDIHLDGTTDNMPNVDPYMLDGKDLDIQSEAGGQAGSVCSSLSTRSWKSTRTPRTPKTRTSTSSAPRSSIASRARNIKDHESGPFLSIDLMPEGSQSPSVRKSGSRLGKSSLHSSHHTLLSASSSGLVSQQSARSVEGGLSPRRPDLSHLSPSSFSSLTRKPAKPNVNVKMPFKQHVVDESLKDSNKVNPGMGLTERTALATHLIHKVLRDQRPSKTHYISGRLLKARLKPLEPVRFSEPTIRQCRGIVAETRNYSPCTSRTFQRWKAIMSGAPVPRAQGATAGRQDLKGRESACESVHCTSEASSPDLTIDLINDLDGNELGDDDDDYLLSDTVDREKLDRELLGPDTRAVASVSLPNSRSGPSHAEESLADIEGPNFQVSGSPEAKDDVGEVGMAEEITERSVQENASEEKRYSRTSESALSCGTYFQNSERNGEDENVNVTGLMAVAQGGRRPHSATYPQEVYTPRAANLRPKTAVDSSRKAVRFADESRVLQPCSQQDAKTGSAANDKSNEKSEEKLSGSKKGKSSCRPQSLDSGFHDKDGGGDGNDEGRGRTFVTQESARSSPSKALSESTLSSQQNHSDSNGGKKQADWSSVSSVSSSSSSNHVGVTNKGDLQDAVSLGAFVDSDNVKNQLERPVSAGVMYAEAKEVTHARVGRMNVKDRLDQRFARYKEGKQNTATRNCHENDSVMKNSDINKNVAKKETTHSNSFNEDTQCTDPALKSEDSQSEPDQSSKLSRTFHRPPSSSSKKAKAYKSLIAKMRKGKVRPYSGSVYADRELKDKNSVSGARRDIQGTPSNFSERSHILSKHGLLGNSASKSWPGSTKPRPASACTAQVKRENEKSLKKATIKVDTVVEKTGRDIKQERDGSRFVYNQYLEVLASGRSRPRSSTKVTFAEKDDYSDGCRSDRRSSSGYPHEQLLSANSPRQLEPFHRASLTLGGSADDAHCDLDQMWDELPCDDSDCEDANIYGHNEGDDDEYRKFMSKFDQLESELSAATRELRRETASIQKKFLSENSKTLQHNQVACVHDEDVKPTAVMRFEGTFITAGDADQVELLEIQDKSEENPESQSAIGSPKSTTPSKSKEVEFLFSAEFSADLYKKTNFYTEVTNKDKRPKSGQKDRNTFERSEGKENDKLAKVAKASCSRQSKRPVSANAKEKVKPAVHIPTCVTLELDAAFEVKKDTRSENENKESLSGQRRLSLSQEGMTEVHGFGGSKDSACDSGDISKGPGADGGVKASSLKEGSGKSGLSLSEQVSEVEKGNTSNNKLHVFKSTAEVPQKTSEASADYHSLILAYRQSCMEDSDDEGSKRENKKQRGSQPLNKKSTSNNLNGSAFGKLSKDRHENRKGTTTSKGGENGSKKSRGEMSFGRKEDETKSSGQRPVSAATTDSGVESDSASHKGLKGLETNHTRKSHEVDSGCDNCQSKEPIMSQLSKSTHVIGLDQSHHANKLSSDQSHPSTQHSGSLCDEEAGGLKEEAEEMLPAQVRRRSQVSEADSAVSDAEPVLGDGDELHSENILPATAKISQSSGPLEIVAEPIKLAKSRAPQHEEDISALSKLPPLCFRLNARPPSGFLYYFAYDSTMNPDRMASYLKSETKLKRFWSILFGFGVVFNKKGGGEDKSVGGFPNLEHNPTSSVEGCIYQLTPEQLTSLDQFMGYPMMSEHVVLPVWMSNCTEGTEDGGLGVAQYCVPAVMYIAKTRATWQEPVDPNQFVVSQCHKAADITSPAYQGHLASFSSPVTCTSLALVAA
ncbi:uncharacterized protein LOC118478605 [Aplysia californica]|uniref:Uncharacterized protein LOC118478605 n=1 Tax=Aplysia californica TaxID=6500 RepID=A0ABM1W172_APLCA|nr:uncharacterized protein LOC118478605 [Aplysia californica]